jgi:hypothetical protein
MHTCELPAKDYVDEAERYTSWITANCKNVVEIRLWAGPLPHQSQCVLYYTGNVMLGLAIIPTSRDRDWLKDVEFNTRAARYNAETNIAMHADMDVWHKPLVQFVFSDHKEALLFKLTWL